MISPKYVRSSLWHAEPLRFLLVTLLFLGIGRVHAQPAPSPRPAPALIKSVRIVSEKDGPAVEILSTKPLIPSVSLLPKDKVRLVIDLPGAQLDIKDRHINVEANQISAIRVNQFQDNPPVARIVVDLLAPRKYSWAAAGNRLLVKLGPVDVNNEAVAPSEIALSSGPKPVATVVPPRGVTTLIGSGMMAGSSVTAGGDTAILRLARGGELHVCPGTTVSVTPSQNGRNLMLSMNTGAFEAHYPLDSSSDSVMTPDFRIQLTGPGEFHFAFSSDNRGNTCVRTLPGNTSSAIVSELMGEGTYQVKAADQLVFRSGHLAQVDMKVPLECGCPPPREPVLRASNQPARERQQPQNTNLSAGPSDGSTAPGRTFPGQGPNIRPVEKSDIKVEVEAPFVFRAGDAPPAQVAEVQALPTGSGPYIISTIASPLPPAIPVASKNKQPARQQSAEHRGFFRRIGSIFSAIFR